jgi:hypothetical protein
VKHDPSQHGTVIKMVKIILFQYLSKIIYFNSNLVILKRFLLKPPNLGENKHMEFVGDSGIPPLRILALFKEKLRNEPNEFFSKSGPFESRQSVWHDL